MVRDPVRQRIRYRVEWEAVDLIKVAAGRNRMHSAEEDRVDNYRGMEAVTKGLWKVAQTTFIG